MSIKAFKVQQFSDQNLSNLNSALKEWTSQFQEIPFLQGRRFDDRVTTGGLSIVHNLGRIPNGWILLGKTSNADVWESEKDSKTLTLFSDGATNFSIWIF